MKARLKQQLLIVSGKMRKDYEEYLDLIPTEQHTEMNWLHQDFLPTLILLPSLCKQRESTDAVALASMLELSYMAHQVHSQAPAEGTPDDYRMPILKHFAE